MLVFLGDVSGKGIPASMFMVRAISLARLLARDIAEPDRILARLNDELAQDNPSGMFVTFLCAVFESGTRHLTLANAGHCRPVLLPADGSPRWAVKNLGTALGFEPGLEFQRTELTLGEGDTLIFYSDGVTEAFNLSEECYGDKRLLTDAGSLSGQRAPAITTELLQKVRAFAGSAPQSDDIAILTFKVNGANLKAGHSERRVTLELHATPEEVMRSVETLQQFAQEGRVPERIIFHLALALEEAGSNIVNHALLRDGQKTFHVTLEQTGDTFVIELRDRGPAFDPTSAPPRKPRVDDDPPGGWGIELIRHYLDEIHYRREGDENVLRLAKCLKEPNASKPIS
jgi:sigma-B regulation protein RsbU (phosphoserine phosphatase)